MTKVVVLKSNEFTPRPDLVGTWLDNTHYHTLVQEDMDLYLPPDCSTEISAEECHKDCNTCTKGLSEKKIVFKFRKGYFSPEMVKSAYEGLRDAATLTQNRGTAAGPREGKQGNREWVSDYQWDIIDAFRNNRGNVFNEDPITAVEKMYEGRDKKGGGSRGQVWLVESMREENFDFDTWVQKLRTMKPGEAAAEAERVEEKLISKTTYANAVNSGIAGWYDRYPRIPYGRATSYTENFPEKFAKSYPYLQHLAKAFKEMLPWRYGNQMAAASKVDPKFLVPDTPFSTITVNRNFRTAAHYDPANMDDGFANICVFSNSDSYRGAYLVFPEIGYAVDVRPGDLLFVNNMAGLHGNTELILDDPNAERISIIAFLHENMLTLGSKEYEDYRREYVEECKHNKENPHWHPKFNGVFKGMWADTEDPKSDYKNAEGWYRKLKVHPKGDEWIQKHHPWLERAFGANNLESFF